MILTKKQRRIVEPSAAECHALGLGYGFGGGGPAFRPTNIAGAMLWLRADLGLTLNVSAVAQWNDLSGTLDPAKNVAQSNVSFQPTFNAADAAYNNKPTISIAAASNQFLQSGAWAAPMVQPWTLVIVGNDDGAATYRWWFDNNTAPSTQLYNNLGSRYDVYAGAALATSVVPSGATPRIWMITASAGTGNVYMTAKTANATGAVGAQGWAGTTIGADRTGGSGLNGKMAEVIAYNSALGPTDRSALWDYLGSRYGIAVAA